LSLQIPSLRTKITTYQITPAHYEGNGENGLEIYFENQKNLDEFLESEKDEDHKITLKGSNSADYVAEG